MPENTSPSPAPDKWALLIGINRYAYAASYGFYDLDGCMNDVADMQAVLIGKFNFPPHHIKVLQDKQATRLEILEAIRTQLVENARPGDIVVLYYSGHGSEVPNSGRINGRDQTIVPYNGRDPDGQVLDISGADLNLAFAALKTRNSTFIFDSCHSGSIRFRKDVKVRSIRPDERFPVESHRSIAQPLPSGQLRPPGAGYALLAACAQNELSLESELNGKPRGLLTYFLCRELRQSTRAQTYRDLMDNLKGAIATENPTQHPQLEGVAVDSCLFGDEEIAAQPYVLVSPQGKNEVRFSAGVEIGMTSGSIYQIYAPGAKLLAHPESALATVQVKDVQDFHAIGYINAGGPVPENSRAVETLHYHQAPVAKVEIDRWEDDATLAKIRLALAQFTQLQLSAAPDSCDIKLWQEAGYIHMESSSGILSAQFPNDLVAVESIAQAAQHWAQWLNLLALNNPAQPALDVRFSIAPVEEDYYPGSQVECIVENNSDIDLYITILDFASDGSIQVIFPIEDPPVLMAKHPLRKLFPLDASPGQAPSGDVLKLIASAQQQDFRILEMRGFKSVPVAQDHFGQLLAAATFGASKGETQWLQPPDWIAINRGLFIRARAATVIASMNKDEAFHD